MLIFGLFFVIGKNINSWVENLEQEQGMQVFMQYDATEEEITKLKEDLGKIEGIEKHMKKFKKAQKILCFRNYHLLHQANFVVLHFQDNR